MFSYAFVGKPLVKFFQVLKLAWPPVSSDYKAQCASQATCGSMLDVQSSPLAMETEQR